jgi:hypothetical protein
MWEPRRLTTLWAFTACYSESFTFFQDYVVLKRNGCLLWCHIQAERDKAQTRIRTTEFRAFVKPRLHHVDVTRKNCLFGHIERESLISLH